jgi:hypothetical protein
MNAQQLADKFQAETDAATVERVRQDDIAVQNAEWDVAVDGELAG